MIDLDGRKFYPYVIFTGDARVMGLDPRSAAEVQRDWVARARRGHERLALQARAAARSEVHNLRLLHRKAEGDPVLEGIFDEKGPSPVTLDEVAQPPAATFEEDEVLTLSGLPDGYGYVGMLAVEVSGIARAGGTEADDFCAGVDTWFAAPRRKKGGGKKKKKSRRGGR